MREPLLTTVPSHHREGLSPRRLQDVVRPWRWRCLEGGAHLKDLPAWLLHWLSLWWHVTTDEKYLRSRISRRGSWKIAVPIIGIAFLGIDCITLERGEGEWWWPLLDIPFVGLAFGYGLSSIGTHILLVDAAASVAFTLMMGCSYFTYSAEDVEEAASDIDAAYVWFPCLLAVTGFVGFHGLSIIAMWVVSMAFRLAFPATGSDTKWLSLLTMTLIAVGAVAMEFTIALLYHEWQRQIHCNEKLLERATDGFGAVDCSTGLVLYASPKLQETLGSSLVGHALASGTVQGRDSVALAKFFGDAEQSLLPEIVLVTWCAGSFELEVRMVPYQLKDSQICFCVQRVGERRCHVDGREPLQVTESAAAPAEEQEQQAEEQPREEGATENSISSSVADLPQAQAGSESAAADINHTPAVRARMTSSGAELPPHAKARRSPRTCSLSSWSISGSGSSKGDRAGRARVAGAPPPLPQQQMKAVDTRTFGVQVDLFAKPPAPLAASTVPKEQQAKTFRKKQLARAWQAAAVEGKPHLPEFAATPRSSRWNALRQVVHSFNIGGQGCCPRHIAWMDVQWLVSEEMLQACGRLPLLADWQCPECSALNSYDCFEWLSELFEDEVLHEQVCGVCHDLVQPRLPEAQRRTVPQGAIDIGMRHNGEDSPAATGSSDGAPGAMLHSPSENQRLLPASTAVKFQFAGAANAGVEP